MKLKDLLKKEKIKAKRYLKEWSLVGSYSPALKKHVYITGLVWNHIVIKKSRHKKEILKRLKVLSRARRIIETKKTISEKRMIGEYTYYALEDKISDEKVRVIITGRPNSQLVLLSIVSIDKQKKREAS